MFTQTISVVLKGTLLLFVIAQFASTTKGTGDGEGLAEVRTFLNEVPNGKKEDFKRRMQADFAFKDKKAKKENPHYKITKEARQVKVGLMASLFSEQTEKEGIEFRQLEDGIKAMFKKGLFDKRLSNLFLHRIDQLAQRPHMGEELAEKLFEADAANEEKRKLRSNVLEVNTKFRLFFYRWLAGLIDHLDYGGNKRAKFYRNELTVNELERGQAFQLYLADWLQNGVLKALGERIFRDLINNQKQNICWEAMVPFCVHTSLRVFLNYDELLILDHHFRLMIIEPDVDTFKVVRDFLHYVTQKLAGQRKTVKWIRDQIFTNLPLLDDPL